MLHVLRTNWFLLALFVVAGLALWNPELLGLAVNWLPPRLAVITMLFTATLSLESRRLLDALARPWPALLAVVVSYGLMPAACLWVMDLDLPVGLRLGLCITASVPCTMSAATIWTRLAGGNEAIALLVTLTTTGTSWLITTAWITLLTGREVELDPIQMMLDLALTLILPVVAAQMLRLSPFVRHFAERRRMQLGIFAQLVILAMVAQSLAVASGHLRNSDSAVAGLEVALVAGLCIAIHLLAAGLGYALARWLRFVRADAIAVTIAGSQKTLPVGLLIIARFFADHPLTVVPLVFYHVAGLVIDTLLARWFRRNGVSGTERTSPTVQDAS